jgi:hypothetical protein
MKKSKNSEKKDDTTESLQEDAKALIAGVFQLFAKHAEDMADDLREFNKKREETRRRIQSGGKRTSGRIV